jgi:hypothetical protein
MITSQRPELPSEIKVYYATWTRLWLCSWALFWPSDNSECLFYSISGGYDHREYLESQGRIHRADARPGGYEVCRPGPTNSSSTTNLCIIDHDRIATLSSRLYEMAHRFSVRDPRRPCLRDNDGLLFMQCGGNPGTQCCRWAARYSDSSPDRDRASSSVLSR